MQSEGPIVVVIDALDECGNAEDRAALLKVLAEELANLPFFSVLLLQVVPSTTSRVHFESCNNIQMHTLDITSDDTQRDIEVYIRHQTTMLRTQNQLLRLPDNWPQEHHIHALVQRASGLFIGRPPRANFTGCI